MIELEIDYSFFPVGQGLFSTGRLTINHNNDRSQVSNFQWVYDCGTTSSQRLVRNALDQFEERSHAPRLNLVVISHFDADHISGIVDLLKRVGADNLMLPWAPLWHRLVIGYSQGLSPEDPEFELYTNPVKYLNDQAGDDFERLIFVPFSFGDGPSEPVDREDLDLGPDIKPTLQFDWDKDLDIEEYSLEEVADWTKYKDEVQDGPEFGMMRRGGNMKFSNLWEFVPYNDPATRPSNEGKFMQEVDFLRNNLLSSNDDNRRDALRKLKRFYVQTFPKSQLNDLSLFLYVGPVGSWKYGGPSGSLNYGGSYEGLNMDLTSSPFRSHFHFCADWADLVYRGSAIYTGDGNLSNYKKWKSFSDYIGTKRAVRPAILQVAHHGSRKSWFDGLADMIEPSVSVFSSDPSHRGYRHPHGDVLRDFLPYRPFQVDRENIFLSKFWLYR